MDVSIRKLEGQEMLDAIHSLEGYGLHPSPPLPDKEEWSAHIRERKNLTCFTAFAEDMPLSVAVCSPMTQNIRGQLYPVSGVWGVSTHPAARRLGVCRATIAALLAAERERGMVFSNLYPFKESFYQRLGYMAFPLTKIARFSPHALAPLLKQDLGGEIEMRLLGPAFEAYRAYVEEMRPRQHGMVLFDYVDPSVFKLETQWAALARVDGRVEGVMLYSMEGEATHFNFRATRFYYRSSRARYLLLNWIARHADQAERVEMWLAPYECPETWLADMQVKVETAERPAMCRVLDVSKLSGMQVGEGRFTARIVDPTCPWNEDGWSFESCDGRLVVSPAAKSDFELAIQGLSGLINGTLDPQDLSFRGWGSPDGETQAVLRRMFPPRMPYMHEMF